MLAVLACWALGTASRLTVWASEEALWREAVAHSPQKPRPLINLGSVLARRGPSREAVALWERGLGAAVHPVRVSEAPMRQADLARLNLALWHASEGRYGQALSWSMQIVQREPARASRVTQLEASWRIEQRAGGPLSAF